MALVWKALIRVRNFAKCAKKAARKRWLSFAKSTLETVGREKIKYEIWKEQVDDVLELYAAWVPWDSSISYQKARERLNLVLDGKEGSKRLFTG